MTQESPNFAIWKPEHDGHAPPNWRDGMAWTVHPNLKTKTPSWLGHYQYFVTAEALNSPNDDARQEAPKELTRLGQEADALDAISLVRKLPADFLAKHGITLAPEKDWATELWADLFAVRGMPSAAKSIREGRLDDEDQAVIALIRERVVLKGEG